MAAGGRSSRIPAMRAFLLLPLLPLIAGCGDDLGSHKGIKQAQADAYAELAKVYDSIKDTPTAKAATSKLEAIMNRIAEAQAAEMKIAAELKIEDLKEDVGEKYEAAKQKSQEALMRLAERLKDNPEAQAIVEKYLR